MVEPLAISGLWAWTPKRFEDPRGWFCEIYSQRELAPHLGQVSFVQDNCSFSRGKGVVRGLHFQIAPFAQAKLIRVTRGSILDIAVDIRRSSPTFGRHVAIELSAANGKQMFIPEGFAHGFATLEPDTEILYKVNAYYSAAHDRGIFWQDPALNIAWPVDTKAAIISDKDQRLPPLADLPAYFD